MEGGVPGSEEPTRTAAEVRRFAVRPRGLSTRSIILAPSEKSTHLRGEGTVSGRRRHGVAEVKEPDRGRDRKSPRLRPRERAAPHSPPAGASAGRMERGEGYRTGVTSSGTRNSTTSLSCPDLDSVEDYFATETSAGRPKSTSAVRPWGQCDNQLTNMGWRGLGKGLGGPW